MGSSQSSQKANREKFLDITRVSSGFRSERSGFTWKIENFDVVRQSKDQICAQKFEFEVGEKIGLPCKMTCYLQYGDVEGEDETLEGEPAKKWIGLYYNLVQAPENATTVNTQAEVEVLNKFGHKVVSLNGGIVDLVNRQGWGFPRILNQEAPMGQLPLINGCLEIYIRFTIFAPNPTVTHSGSLARIKKVDENGLHGMNKSLHNLLKDFGKMLEEGNKDEEGDDVVGPPRFFDVKIITRDQQVLKAHRAVLSARSPVFEAMFRNNMLESQTGVIRMEDVSYPTVKLLLQFIYTGTLPHNWFKADVIVELTSAAAKYDLKDLLDFLDSKLGSVCDEQTAGKLLLLVSRLHLTKAEKEILEYIKHHGVSKSKDFLCIVKNIATPPEDVSK